MRNVTKAKPDQPFKNAPNIAMGQNTGVAKPSTSKKGRNIPRFAGLKPHDPSQPTIAPSSTPVANPATIMTKDGVFIQGKGMVERQVPPPVEEDNWSSAEDKSPVPEVVVTSEKFQAPPEGVLSDAKDWVSEPEEEETTNDPLPAQEETETDVPEREEETEPAVETEDIPEREEEQEDA
jgi:hypothetical protein